MSIVKIEKADIVFPIKLKEQVLDLLQEKGIVQVDNFTKETIKKYQNTNQIENIKCVDCEYVAAEAQFAINFLENFKKIEKKSLIEKIKSDGFLKIYKNDYEDAIKNFDYKKIIEECKNLEENINLSQNKIEELKQEKINYKEWKDLKIDFSKSLETENTKTLIGTIKTTDYDKLMENLAKGDRNFELQKISQNNTETKIIFIYLKNKEEAFRKILSQTDFEEVVFPGLNSTIQNKIENLEQSTLKYLEEKEKLVLKAKKLAKKQNNLKIIFDYYSSRLEREEASEHILDMNFVSAIQVWVPAKQLDNIKEDLQKISKRIDIFKVELREGEEVPVVLKNSDLIEPFEGVTNIYGLPKANEVDPTWWLSLSFLIFFGFCLSDAGYGLFLIAASLIAIKVLKVPREKQGMMRLIAYCGIFTFIIGAMFGGWFGINLDTLAPGFFGDILRKIRLVNPMEDPLMVMYVAFALGFVHILWGIIAKFYQSWRDKNYLEAILDSGLWLYFLPVLAYWAITQSQTAKTFVLAGVVILVLTQGRKSKNIFAKFFGGVLSLYNVVGYFSDILSYSRLLALGLATSVIAVIVNQIAVLMGNMIPYVGWIIMILIIVLGHIFNLAINVLGSYIHSSRLEFVEFFGKFIEGGGRLFEPFRKKFKYIMIRQVRTNVKQQYL
jgi:V/A-type H+-transporting ATPase subunit I